MLLDGIYAFSISCNLSHVIQWEVCMLLFSHVIQWEVCILTFSHVIQWEFEKSEAWGGRMYGRTDGRKEIHPCVLQDIGPLGPLPKKGKQRTVG